MNIVIEQSRLFDFIKNPKAILLRNTLSTKKTPKLLKNRKYLNSSMLKSFVGLTDILSIDTMKNG